MDKYRWSDEKDLLLRQTRGIGFADVLAAIEAGSLLADLEHPNQDRYPGQRVLLVPLGDYTYAVPYVRDDEGLFLKTIFPSRKAHRDFKRMQS